MRRAESDLQQQEEANGRESIDRLKEQIAQCEWDLQRQVFPSCHPEHDSRSNRFVFHVRAASQRSCKLNCESWKKRCVPSMAKWNQ